MPAAFDELAAGTKQPHEKCDKKANPNARRAYGATQSSARSVKRHSTAPFNNQNKFAAGRTRRAKLWCLTAVRTHQASSSSTPPRQHMHTTPCLQHQMPHGTLPKLLARPSKVHRAAQQSATTPRLRTPTYPHAGDRAAQHFYVGRRTGQPHNHFFPLSAPIPTGQPLRSFGPLCQSPRCYLRTRFRFKPAILLAQARASSWSLCSRAQAKALPSARSQITWSPKQLHCECHENVILA